MRDIDFIFDKLYEVGEISICGNYTLSKNEAKILADYSIKSGENYFSYHQSLTHCLWQSDDPCRITDDDFDLLLKSRDKSNINPDAFTGINMGKIDRFIYDMKKTISMEKSYSYLRNLASQYTSNSIVRKKVFNKNGRFCSNCLSDKNLTLDHVIPVKLGGENSIENLQVLCKSCNSSKGAKYECI